MSDGDLFNYHLRVVVYQRFKEWGVPNSLAASEIPAFDHLCDLCGVSKIVIYQRGMPDEMDRTCRQLIGPYGYAVYKMLLAKRSAK